MLDWLRENVSLLMETAVEWITAFSAWLAAVMLTLGYPGVFFLMAVESSLIPFPSELVMPPAGYLVHEGQMTWFMVIASGTLGSLAGALFNYYLALYLGRPFFLRYGKYFFLKPDAIEKAERFFATHGDITTFVARLLPVIRQLISLPAGAARMPLGKFCLYSSLGAGIWVTVLTWIGWLVGRNRDMVHLYMRNATLWAVGGAVLVALAYVKYYRWRKNRGHHSAAAPAASGNPADQSIDD